MSDEEINNSIKSYLSTSPDGPEGFNEAVREFSDDNLHAFDAHPVMKYYTENLPPHVIMAIAIKACENIKKRQDYEYASSLKMTNDYLTRNETTDVFLALAEVTGFERKCIDILFNEHIHFIKGLVKGNKGLLIGFCLLLFKYDFLVLRIKPEKESLAEIQSIQFLFKRYRVHGSYQQYYKNKQGCIDQAEKAFPFIKQRFNEKQRFNYKTTNNH
ncbi:MAG TPA: hypothetical protein VK172_00865 [Lentimicrobium sp.]|jgi:hypothetical protein|nr:hypothetical protein [Lentimicrobium sp.]